MDEKGRGVLPRHRNPEPYLGRDSGGKVAASEVPNCAIARYQRVNPRPTGSEAARIAQQRQIAPGRICRPGKSCRDATADIFMISKPR